MKENIKTDVQAIKLAEKYLPRINSASDLDPAILLKDLGSYVNKEITVNGWVFNIRSSGKIMFLQIRDGSGEIQAVASANEVGTETWQQLEELTNESSLQVKGKVKEEPRAPSGFELQLSSVKIIQIAPEYPLGKKEHGPDFLLDNRHLWLRSKKQRAVMELRDEIFFTIMAFLREQGFFRFDTPIFQPVSCEDTSELFAINYFGKKSYLTQSGQLYCEVAEFALGRTYDFGPVFRAEKSKTRKHLIEFWMLDAELPFTDLNGLMEFEETMIKSVISSCLKNRSRDLEILERDTDKLERYTQESFIKIKHHDVIKLLNEKFNGKLSELDDIGAPEEGQLSQIYDLPVFVTDWPAEIKAFYMAKYQDGAVSRARCVDLIAPEGFGEITGGGEREFDYNKLLKVLEEKNYPFKDYSWYMDLRKYGTIPHSGFGIGLERLIRFITGVPHIRETIPFPRMLNRLYP